MHGHLVRMVDDGTTAAADKNHHNSIVLSLCMKCFTEDTIKDRFLIRGVYNQRFDKEIGREGSGVQAKMKGEEYVAESVRNHDQVGTSE